ncbi:MAG: 50S ribosomal protein L24 [Bacteroidales bacterium]
MQRKFHIKKGDMVIVVSGEDKGKKGRVLEVLRSKERAIVEGINIIKKHTKPSQDLPEGGIVEKEAPIHISNLMYFDAKSNAGTRIGRREDKNGKLVRYSKKSGEDIK